MARAQKQPSYRHHKPSGNAVVTIDRRDHYLGPYDSPESHSRYAEMIERWRRKELVLSTAASEARTVVEIVAAFDAYARARYTRSKEADNFAPVLRILRDRFGHIAADRFGPRFAKELRRLLIEEGRTRTSVNRLFVRLRTIFRWAAAEELVPADVAHALSMIRGLREGEGLVREGRAVTLVERSTVERTLPHLPPQLQAAVRLQLMTGMRPGEVCAMTPGQIDCSGAIWWYQPRSHKTGHHGKHRRIAIVPQAADVLRPYLLRAADSPCFSPTEATRWRFERRRERRVTPAGQGNEPGTNRSDSPRKQPGERYTAESYGRAIAYACRSAGVPRWAPNQIRHLVATEVRRAHGLEAARIVCGHSVAAVTEQYYAEVNAERAAEILAATLDARREAI